MISSNDALHGRSPVSSSWTSFCRDSNYCEISLGAVAVYQTEGEDLDGNTKYFKKPWASTALMFLAMVMCLPIAWIAAAIESRRKKSAASSERKPLLGEEGETSTEEGKRHSSCSIKVHLH